MTPYFWPFPRSSCVSRGYCYTPLPLPASIQSFVSEEMWRKEARKEGRKEDRKRWSNKKRFGLWPGIRAATGWQTDRAFNNPILPIWSRKTDRRARMSIWKECRLRPQIFLSLQATRCVIVDIMDVQIAENCITGFATSLKWISTRNMVCKKHRKI